MDADRRRWLAVVRPSVWRGNVRPRAARAVVSRRLRFSSASIRGYSDEGFDRGWTQIDADGWRWSGPRFGEEMSGPGRLGPWSLGDFASHRRPSAVTRMKVLTADGRR